MAFWSRSWISPWCGMPDEPTTTMMVEYGGEQIPVAIAFRNRQRLSISVHPDCSVTALAPAGCPPEKLQDHLERRRAWIARQRHHFETFHPLPGDKHYLSGETHLYLGRQYRLKIHHAREAEVKLIGRFLHAAVPEPEAPRCVREALDAWYLRPRPPHFPTSHGPLYRYGPDSAGGVTHPENPLNDPALGQLLQEGDDHPQHGVDQNAASLHRVRDHARALSSPGPRPRAEVFSVAGSVHAGLGGTEGAARRGGAALRRTKWLPIL